ncbi:type II secretion system protein GspD [Desulfurispira natronophila]|uniref:MSHA biogenesis protein MshL n=1 Tax=Desulfurispira natronophila TaxID=682562 RepID=A0A7W8DGA0_9BACT|nr:hypothetical protein [Desulfurispira natronophila]MBB5021271.1 MSHA biogenesis protein MshL [Desulfurispira natronophila]
MEYRRSAILIGTILLLLVIAGCAKSPTQQPLLPSEERQAMPTFDDSFEQAEPGTELDSSQLPPAILPSPFAPVSPLAGLTPVSIRANETPLRTILNIVAEDAGLNVVFHRGVPQREPLSLVLDETPFEEALDTIMEISGCYYQLRGHSLHVHRFETRTFSVPYVHTRSSFTSNLGGDVLGGSGAGSNYRGEFSMRYDNPEEMNDFYQHIHDNVESLLSEEGRLVMNRFSGILSVTDHRSNVDRIEDMLKQILDHSMKQVLIEAQIFEVVLNDSYSLGINWSDVLSRGDGTFSLAQATSGGADTVTGSIRYTRNNFQGVLDVMQTAGNVQTLSNPRIRVMNSQTAIIASGRITPFWTKRVDYSEVGGQINRIETYDRRDVLSGISMGVTPVITNDGTIMLNVIPVSTNFEEIDHQRDSSGDLIVSAPVVNMKEAGTIIRVQDDDMVIIGGLISTSTREESQSVLGLAAIPWLGHLFRGVSTVEEKRELVIFLRIRSLEV